jgi:hypothetical protein
MVEDSIGTPVQDAGKMARGDDSEQFMPLGNVSTGKMPVPSGDC